MRERRGPGRRPRQVGDADDTRREIIGRAMELFHTRGFPAVSMDEIAGEAGVTKATLYYHFPGKGEIFAAGVAQIVGQVHGLIAAIASQKELSVQERLRRMLETRRMILDREPRMAWNFATLGGALQHLSSDQQLRVREHMASLQDPLRELMAEGIESGEFRDLGESVLAVLFWQLVQPTTYLALPGRLGASVDAAILDVFFNGALRDGDVSPLTTGGETTGKASEVEV